MGLLGFELLAFSKSQVAGCCGKIVKVGADFGAATMHAHAIGAAHATDELSVAADAREGKSRGRERGPRRRGEGEERDGTTTNEHYEAAIG